MAVSLTAPDLSFALKFAPSVMEASSITFEAQLVEAERLLAYATLAVERHAPDAPAVVQNEAVIRLSGYLHETAGHDGRYYGVANPLGNSGAVAILLPYRVHRAGLLAESGTDDETATITGNQIAELLDEAIGTDWRTGGGGA